ncbi:MAG: GTPase ObgE [bacterium]
MTTFIDKARVYLKAGSGGNGCLSFRREKYIPFGGPDGGSGGKGGDIYLISDPNLTTLVDVTYRPHFNAPNGYPGLGKNKYGKAGEDLEIRLPCGTVVYKNGEFFKDLSISGERVKICIGGRGGRGNAAFKTSRQTAPRIAEKGQPGEQLTLDLELKSIADVGLVGYPNAGKSTLLSRISNAHPKIADYPFTTLRPNLGAVAHKGKNLVAADIPGIIDDAHKGKGLGLEFLRHIERTKVLIHVIDLFGFENEEAFVNWKAIAKELDAYGHDVSIKPYVIALNKIDLTGWEEKFEKFQRALKKWKKGKKKRMSLPIYLISAISGEGIEKLLDKVIYMLANPPKQRIKRKENKEVSHYTYEPEFNVNVENEFFIVSGKKVEDLVAMTNFSQEEAVVRLQHILKKMGVDKTLIQRGIKQGQMVKIGTFEFEFENT